MVGESRRARRCRRSGDARRRFPSRRGRSPRRSRSLRAAVACAQGRQRAVAAVLRGRARHAFAPRTPESGISCGRASAGAGLMIIGTAGHIDHGKTSLVRALTGVDTDRLKEEKARGISIELGFAYLPSPGGPVLGFIDVPGHEKFIHTMLAGATGVDYALLVIAADD